MTAAAAKPPISLADLAIQFGCELIGDPDATVTHVATLSDAGAGALSFLANPRYGDFLATSAATAVIVRPSDAATDGPSNRLVHADPYATYAAMAQHLYPGPALRAGVHASAYVDSTASVDPSAEVGPGVVIGAGAAVGANCRIGANCVIGDGASLGANSALSPNVTLADSVVLGMRCRVQSGAVIGSDGFGFAPTSDGWRRVPQVGSVQIGDDVDIGANTTIDRGAIGDTVIGDDVKLDNLVQIAHNVRIGAHTAMAAQCGIAGSTVIGERCLFAGHSGAVGHVTICDGVIVNGKTMVTKDITKPGAYGAALPAMPISDYRRVVARIRQLDKLAARVAALVKHREKSS
ncbi:MAG: UDP-3-O-(3-hydroxymyristoyl)glucosamine N-acyltransferase [Pseudomonadota bacterium]